MALVELPYNFMPRTYQVPVWKHMEGTQEGKRAVCVWHRRAGKDLIGINLVSCKHVERIGTYWHLLPTYKQGRAIVWNGFTRDGRRFLDHFPPQLIKGTPNATEMRVTFTNGSNYQVVGTDDINSLVGTNPIGCIFSEYSLHDPGAWNYIRPILAENGGWALFIYTARGKNHGYKLLQMARDNKKWFSEVLVAGSGPRATKRPDGSPVISDEIIEDERNAGMPEEMVQQEFYCSFEAPLVGSYYGKQMALALEQGRITSIPYEPKLPVDTYWDIGYDDSTTIWFAQHYGLETRLIDYYSASGEGLPHYAKVLRGQVDEGEHRREYLYGVHHAPHDIEVHEFTSGKSRIESARELGIRFKTTNCPSIEDGIEAARNLIPMCWFDEKKCEQGIECLKSYRKDWDDKNKTFRSTALHDWASHGADAFRILAWARKGHKKNRRPQHTAVDTFQYV